MIESTPKVTYLYIIMHGLNEVFIIILYVNKIIINEAPTTNFSAIYSLRSPSAKVKTLFTHTMTVDVPHSVIDTKKLKSKKSKKLAEDSHGTTSEEKPKKSKKHRQDLGGVYVTAVAENFLGLKKDCDR